MKLWGRSLWGLVLCGIWACGGQESHPGGDTGGAGAQATAGISGTAGTGIAGGAAGMGTDEVLTLTLIADTLPLTAADRSVCAGDCVAVSAEVMGGVPPYSYAWSDASLQGPGPHQVCPAAALDLSVTVTDAPGVEEFERAPISATRSGRLVPQPCESKPGDPCTERAPDGTTGAMGEFDPIEEWRWTGNASYITPLVANFTDDNADGAIDTRDTPDVVLTVMLDTAVDGAIVVLDGATGSEHFRIPNIFYDCTPALGDIDNDGDVDIVATQKDPTTGELRVAAYGHDGQPLWNPPSPIFTNTMWPASIAIADLDNDGTPEILNSTSVFDNQGTLLWTASDVVFSYLYNAPTAVDLDGNGDLEVVFGPVAYHHDGVPVYTNNDIMLDVCVDFASYCSYFVAVADFDADDKPEIVVTTRERIFVLDNAGTTLRQSPLYLGSAVGPDRPPSQLAFPPAIADVNGDGTPEILMSNGVHFIAFDALLQRRWSASVIDSSGIAAGTAFDFLGDGSAEAMYADEQNLFAFDGLDGHVILMRTRYSGTVIEYPTVADVDNDGAAEVLVVSMQSEDPDAPQGLRVFGDRHGRWVPARRIFNQDTYHVTNVNEDGSIPQHEQPHWTLNNTFRAQGQINADGTVCLPVVE